MLFYWCKVTSVILLKVTGVIDLKVASSLKVAGVILSKHCWLLVLFY